jgi:hypothetical protein
MTLIDRTLVLILQIALYGFAASQFKRMCDSLIIILTT